MEVQSIIKKIASIFVPNPKLETVDNPNGDGTLALVANGFEIKPLAGPKAHARRSVFSEIASFAEWVKTHTTAPAKADILVSPSSIDAALDAANVSGDRVTCTLEEHVSFKELRKVLGRELDQKQFLSFVRANLGSFDETTGQVLTSELRKLSVAIAHDANVEIDELGCTRFSGKTTKTTIEGKIPADFDITIPVLNQVCDPATGKERTYGIEIMIELAVDEEEKAAVFTLTCPALDLILEQARRDAVVWVKHLLGEGFQVGLGTLRLEQVPTKPAA